MALTPVEIRHMTPSTGFMGYNRGQTDRLLEDIAASFEDVWRERADLADKVEQLESDLVRFKELETLLRTTLMSAGRRRRDERQARREAELILSEAHAEARASAPGGRRRAAAAERRGECALSFVDALAVLEKPAGARPTLGTTRRGFGGGWRSCRPDAA